MKRNPLMRLGNVPDMDIQSALHTKVFLDQLVSAFEQHCSKLIDEKQNRSTQKITYEHQLTLPFLDVNNEAH